MYPPSPSPTGSVFNHSDLTAINLCAIQLLYGSPHLTLRCKVHHPVNIHITSHLNVYESV